MIMDIRHIPLIILAFAVAGCTKTVPEKVSDGVPEPISFSAPAVAPKTKTVAGEMGSNYDTSEHLSVYGLLHTGPFADLSAAAKASSNNLMTNVDCAYNSTLGGWDPRYGNGGQAYYWPVNPDARITFQAYSPTGANMTPTHSWTSGFVFTNFTPAEPGAQYDLLYTARHADKQKANFSGSPYDETTGDQGSYNGVDLVFRHALSSIVFKVKTAANGLTTFYLKSIRLINVYPTGTFTQNLAADNSETPTWSASGTERFYQVFSSAEGELLSTTSTKKGNTMLLVPQDMLHTHGSDPDTHISIEIVYYTKTGSTQLPDQTVTVDLVIGNGGDYFQGSIDGGTPFDIDKWQYGYRYTYNLSIGFNKIFLDPQTSAWTSGGSSSVEY